jgi:hypothetical protein
LVYRVAIIPLSPTAAPALVPVFIVGQLTSSATVLPNIGGSNILGEVGFSDAAIGFEATDEVTNGTCSTTFNNGPCNTSTSTPINHALLVPVNNNLLGNIINVDESVSVIALNDVAGLMNLSVMADPYFYIDPSFPDANQYSIIVSPGVGNASLQNSIVPEPPSLLLLGVGLVVTVCLSLFHRERLES